MPDALPAPIKLEVPSDLIFVRPVRKMVEGLLQAHGWGEDDVDDASLIVTEIVQNAVEHGSRADGRESIRVEVRMETDAVEFIVVDPGTGDDPALALLRDVETRPPLEDSRGRGLYLIFRLACELDRSLVKDGGLCIRARKVATTDEVEA
jgi:anti-sigma regulatory factor (Ser/Thr protein kinase)